MADFYLIEMYIRQDHHVIICTCNLVGVVYCLDGEQNKIKTFVICLSFFSLSDIFLFCDRIDSMVTKLLHALFCIQLTINMICNKPCYNLDFVLLFVLLLSTPPYMAVS